MKIKLLLVTSLVFIANFFLACSSSVNTPKLTCAKEKINNCNQEQKLQIIKKRPELIEYINKPNKELQIEALKQDPSLIRFIKKPSKEAMLY